jgi:hypothetical protein
MGLGDNRRSPKMSRKVAQAKLKARQKRKREAAHAERVAARPPVKHEKKK